MNSNLSLSLYFMNGFINGIKTTLKMQKIGLGILKTKRLNPMELVIGHGVNDTSGLTKILNKATEIEVAKIKT